MGAYVFDEDGGEEAHDDGDGGLMQEGDLVGRVGTFWTSMRWAVRT